MRTPGTRSAMARSSPQADDAVHLHARRGLDVEGGDHRARVAPRPPCRRCRSRPASPPGSASSCAAPPRRRASSPCSRRVEESQRRRLVARRSPNGSSSCTARAARFGAGGRALRRRSSASTMIGGAPSPPRRARASRCARLARDRRRRFARGAGAPRRRRASRRERRAPRPPASCPSDETAVAKMNDSSSQRADDDARAPSVPNGLAPAARRGSRRPSRRPASPAAPARRRDEAEQHRGAAGQHDAPRPRARDRELVGRVAEERAARRRRGRAGTQIGAR